MADENQSRSTQDSALRRFREYVAAGIAVIIVLGTVLMMIVALQATSNAESPEQFAQVKDLLLIINPLLGVVVGYYFNKVSTEARAENAEATAHTAVITAQEAAKTRDAALEKAEDAKAKTEKVEATLQTTQQRAEEMKGVLKDMTLAAEKVMAQTSTEEMGILTTKDIGTEPVNDGFKDLRAALDRAHRVIG
ncbi:MAG: hypothetical protein KDJ52_34605 [Anaerolineae bacterium]|nr:hypothetical protein [Anaerolineae bacterium]